MFIYFLHSSNIFYILIYINTAITKHHSLKSPAETFLLLKLFERMYHPQWKCIGWFTIEHAKKKKKRAGLKK